MHRVGIVGMGRWVIDAANCEELLAYCQRPNRCEITFIVAPQQLNNATGSSTSPLAIF